MFDTKSRIWKDLLGIKKWKNSKIIENIIINKINLFNLFALYWIIPPSKVIYKKAKKWFNEVPTEWSRILGCIAKSPYKILPIILPG